MQAVCSDASQMALGQGWELPQWKRGSGSVTFQGHAPSSPLGRVWDKTPMLGKPRVCLPISSRGLLLPPGLGVMDQSWISLILRSTADVS